MKYIKAIILLSLGLGGWLSADSQSLTEDFSDNTTTLNIVGRGNCSVKDGLLHAKDAYALFGSPDWKDYTVSFKARTPGNESQVQIWAGFRTHNRFDRYVLGIKGGLQDDLYLMRTGYMGTDEFMAVRPLGFHPEPGQWIDVKVDVCGRRIRVFINGTTEPYIDLEDKNSSMAPAGGVALGGGWICAEFDDLRVTPLASGSLDNVAVKELGFRKSDKEKEQMRVIQRNGYSDRKFEILGKGRTELSLNGDWLFMPTYQLNNGDSPASPDVADDNWHVMNVPDFWSPIRIWLHGETMPSPTGPQPKGVSDTYYQRETDRCENYTFDYRKTAGAWYRQWIELPKNIKGKQFTLQFDAVSKLAEVYVNGNLVSTHLGMFGNFNVDATKYLHPGRNLIAVNVTRDIKGGGAQTSEAMENYYSSVRKNLADNKDDKQANKEFITDIPHGFFGDNPAGIWQPVKLVVTDPLKIEDVFIRPSLNGADFDIEIRNNSNKSRSFGIYADITDKATGETIYSGTLLSGLKLSGNSSAYFNASVGDLKPKLWEPSSPNLYDFKFRIKSGKELIDDLTITSGFRTFETKDGFFYLNGRKFWLRGGNHIPFSLGMNDRRLADGFMQLMRDGNVNSTRTHTTPWNELWMDAADRNGIAVSFEGTWSWLMIHSTPIPSEATLNLWKNEWLQVMKKFRNHPSLIFWTINNEMKFYDLDADIERAKKKMTIISDVVKEMRALDSTRPVSFDSNYMRRNGVKRFGNEFMSTIDDGDIDDNHGYYNWYDYSLFQFFNGEFQQRFKTPGRPLISQEMSTGYPNAETGHPTRSYQLVHQNPFTLVGYEAYDFADPARFLKSQAFITGELAETLRRTNDQAAGIMHFAYMTWFRQCYDIDNIAPWPAYYAMQRAMQPILVSAELWGRNIYAGDTIATRIYVVNDSEDGRDLNSLNLTWRIVDGSGNVIASDSEKFPSVSYYGRKYIEPVIVVPDNIGNSKIYGKLELSLTENGKEISANSYDLIFAGREWSSNRNGKSVKLFVVANDSTHTVATLEKLGYDVVDCANINEMLNQKNMAQICVLAGNIELSDNDVALLRNYQKQGGRLLTLNAKEASKSIYPEYISDWIIPTEGDIVVMERSDSPVFDGLDPLDLRYFNNGKREMPKACNAVIKAIRHENLKELASHMRIHAYIDGRKAENRMAKIEAMRGLTLLEITDGSGRGIVSTMSTEKADTDPIAGRLLSNLIDNLSK